MRPRFTGLWRHPDFVKLWAGQTVSIFGTLVGWTALQFTAILWLGATPLQVSLLGACQLAPGFLAGLVAGVWVDRLRRRPILIAADAGRAIGLATIPLAALFGVLHIEQLYLVAALTSVFGVFFDVAYQSYLPSLVRRDELVEGNSKLTASASVAEFGGFSLSGWLVQALNGPAAVLIDAVSFVWSACFIALIRGPEPPPIPREDRRAWWPEVIEGARVVWRGPVLRALAAAAMLQQFSSRIIGAVILIYLNREVGFGPGVLGVIFAVGGLSSLLGSLVAGRTAWIGGLGRALVVAQVVTAAGTLFIPLTVTVSLLGIILLVANQLVTDPAATIYQINEVSLRQAITPDRRQGRMNATMRVAEFGAMLLGTLAGGLLAQAIGSRGALWVACGGQFAAALWLLLSPVFVLRVTPAGEHDGSAAPLV